MANIKIKFNKKEKTILSILIVIAVILFAALGVVSLFPNRDTKDDEKPDFSKVKKVFELTTVKCFYHDVAEGSAEPGLFFKYGLFKIGYKKFFLEYDGIVELGMDGNKIRISKPDENNNVKAYVPKVKLLDVSADNDSLKEVWNDHGAFTTITTQDKNKAFQAAQKTMRENTKKDKEVIDYANNRNKVVVEKYIQRVGKARGEKYDIIWVNDPKEVK